MRKNQVQKTFVVGGTSVSIVYDSGKIQEVKYRGLTAERKNDKLIYKF